MVEFLKALLAERAASADRGRILSLHLLGYGTVGLLALATLGFLMVALHATFVGLTDHMAAPLLMAATLATTAALVLLAMRLVRHGSSEKRKRGAPQAGDAGALFSLVLQMSEAIATKKVPPLAAVGLALTTGLAQGMRK